MNNYSEILKSNEWKQKRLVILKRDNFKCQHCSQKDNLQVHHKKYIKGKMPWEVPNNYLITLCSNCHTKEHEGKHISTFTKSIKSKNKISVSKKQKVANRIQKMYSSMTKSDLKIQSMYDNRA